MSLRVGRIPFLVCAPFFHDFIGREGECREFDFVDGPPSAHCRGLMDGSIDLSPASSITFALKPGAFVLSPALCTSCSFEVRSVKLFSHYPIEKLGGRAVRITSQSRTSVALLRILLEMRYGVMPEYKDGLAAEAGDDACLLIGDMALEENERNRFEYGYDLGSLWQEWQGLPFVFGAWVISKAAAQRDRAALERYMQLTEASIADFRANVSAALDRWLARYPVSLPRHVVEDYYKVIDYRFTDERKQSLSLFLCLAARMGLAQQNLPLEYL